jgi:CheY-like chemotaxis protein
MEQLDMVMLVDDDSNWRYLTERILMKAGLGLQIITANNGQDAIEKLQTRLDSRERLPDVIFLDIQMPVMDGFAVLEELSKWPELDFEKTRIFLCSSSSHFRDEERARQYPIAGYITKPLTREVLSQIFSR